MTTQYDNQEPAMKMDTVVVIIGLGLVIAGIIVKLTVPASLNSSVPDLMLAATIPFTLTVMYGWIQRRRKP